MGGGSVCICFKKKQRKNEKVCMTWQRNLVWLAGTHRVVSRKRRAAAGSCMAGRGVGGGMLGGWGWCICV